MAVAEDIVAPSLNLIPKERIDAVLPVVEKQLRAVVERARGALTPDEIIEAFRSGRYQLWVIWNGNVLAVGATEIVAVASGMRLCLVHFLTGEHSLEWLHLLEELEAWAKSQGCSRMKGQMRKGWAKRLPDYHMTHVTLEKDLV